MSTTDDTNAARRGAGSNDLLGLAQTRAEVDALMKRCQIGVGGRHALDNAHSIMADCYGTLGRQQIEIERLRALLADVYNQTRHPDYDWPSCLQREVDEALWTNAEFGRT